MSSEIGDSWSDILTGFELERGRARVEVPAGWGQGRSTFGGLLAALGLEAMAVRLQAELAERGEGRRRIRSMQVVFVGPVAVGEVELGVELLRHGRSATTLRAELEQDGRTRCLITGCFAADRESSVELAGAPRPALAGPEGLVGLPYVEGLTPKFTRHLELRWAEGGPPASRLDDASAAGWIRFRTPQRPGPSAVIALVDAWPAPTLQMLDRFALASSLSWSLDFVAEDSQAKPEDWWAFAVDSDRASGGWVHTSARLWSPAGALVATSRQTVAMFA